jgi:hypothetical protein
MAEATVELLERGVRVHHLDIPQPAVADYLRQFPEGERELQFIEAIDVGVFCLERAAATRDLDFVRSQVDAILKEVERAVSGIPDVLEGGLAQKLGAEDGQVLAPIRTMVDTTSRTLTERVNGVRDLLATEIDPDKSTSTIGRALGQLKDMLDGRRKDSVQATLAGAVQSVTGEHGVLAKAVQATVAEAIHPLADEVNRISKQIAAAEAAEEAIAGTTKKGAPYEEEVLAHVVSWSAAMGAEVHHVGPDNRPGDIVLKFGEASVAAGLCVVLEARDRMSPLGRKAIVEVADKAMAERGANASIYLSRSRDGLALEIGEWAEGESDRGPWIATTHEHLFVAIRFLLVLHRLTGLKESRAAVDLAAVDGQISRIRTALRKIGTIKRNVTAIRSSAGSIEEEAETLQSDTRRALFVIEETLHTREERPAA